MNTFFHNNYQPDLPCAVALGNFDGVHAGHAQIVRTMLNAAEARNLRSVVWTFDKHPANVMAGKIVSPLITTNEIKIDLMRELGVENMVLVSFTKKISKMSPAEFVKEILINQLNAKYVVCGFNHHFGHRGQGDSECLRMLCREQGIEVEVVRPVTCFGQLISSSLLRELIIQGEMETADTLLGHPFVIQTTVIGGQQLARKLGFPTINQQFSPESIVPKHGVYVTTVALQGRLYQGVTNVGMRPTVNGTVLTAETHLFGFSGNLYGSKIKVNFLHMLRPEIRFEGVEELATQVAQDIAETKAYFNSNISGQCIEMP